MPSEKSVEYDVTQPVFAQESSFAPLASPPVARVLPPCFSPEDIPPLASTHAKGLHQTSLSERTNLPGTPSSGSFPHSGSPSIATSQPDLQGYRQGPRTEAGALRKQQPHRKAIHSADFSEKPSPCRPGRHVRYVDARHLDEKEDEYDAVDLEDRALWFLIHLSLFSPFLSLIIFLWTIVILILFAILSPLRLCRESWSSCRQTNRHLVSPLDLQLRLIYSSDKSDTHSTAMLVLVHALSPCVSLGIAVAAWVAAVFWFYAVILGDPDGRNGRDDGRAAMLRVRRWWESWLVRAIR